MPVGIRIRILALASVAVASMLGARVSLVPQGAPTENLSWPCRLGPWTCKELRDPMIEEWIRANGGGYFYREYRSGAQRVSVFAIASSQFSFKDPSSCFRAQGWTLVRNEPITVVTATAIVPARAYELASPVGEPIQTYYAIGLWRRGDKFITNPLGARIYGLFDDLFYVRPSLTSIHIETTLDTPSAGADLRRGFAALQAFLKYWSPG